MTLAGCDPGAADQKLPAAPPAAALSHGSTQARIRASFDTYYIALARGEFTVACGRLAPETVAKATREAGAGNCTQALRELYSKSGKIAHRQLHDIATTAEIQRIDYDSSSATITWLASVRGHPYDATQQMRRIGAQWKLVDASG